MTLVVLKVDILMFLKLIALNLCHNVKDKSLNEEAYCTYYDILFELKNHCNSIHPTNFLYLASVS